MSIEQPVAKHEAEREGEVAGTVSSLSVARGEVGALISQGLCCVMGEFLDEKSFVNMLRTCRHCRNVLSKLVQEKRDPKVAFMKMLPKLPRTPGKSTKVNFQKCYFSSSLHIHLRDNSRGEHFRAIRSLHVFVQDNQIKIKTTESLKKNIHAPERINSQTYRTFNLTAHINENPRLVTTTSDTNFFIARKNEYHTIASYDDLWKFITSEEFQTLYSDDYE